MFDFTIILIKKFFMKTLYEFFIEYLNEQPAFTVAYGLAVLFLLLPGQVALNLTAVTSITFRPETYQGILRKILWYVAGKLAGYFMLGLLFLLFTDLIKKFVEVNHAFYDLVLFCSAPFIIFLGFFLLASSKLSFKKNGSDNNFQKEGSRWWVFFSMGLIFSFIFCTFSAFVFFGIFLPQLKERSFFFLLISFFTLITSLPVVILSLAFNGLALHFYKKIENQRKAHTKFHQVMAVVYVIIGVFYTLLLFFN